MGRLVALALVLLCAACSPSSKVQRPEQIQARQLNLYLTSTETRLFANPIGFEFPEGVSLEQVFDRESGALLTSEEAAAVADSVSVIPPPEEVAACAHTWRHVFVFYSENGSPLGALAYCMECGAVTVIGPDDPGVDLSELVYDGEGLQRIIGNHNMIVEERYPEYPE